VDYQSISANDLAQRCFDKGDEFAWAEFVRRFQPLIARVVLRVSRQWGECSSQTADDLVQETYLKLCGGGLRGIQNFKCTHEDAIYGYIKVFTSNLVHDHFKANRSQKRGGGTAVRPIDGEDICSRPAEDVSRTSIERDVLIKEVDACLHVVSVGPSSERDRKIFWLYYRVGLAASAIAALPTIKLSTKGVESTLLRLTKLVRQRLISPKQESSSRDSQGKGIGQAEAL
jgi:RNA polymerase sigma factor (sigma-70 family)